MISLPIDEEVIIKGIENSSFVSKSVVNVTVELNNRIKSALRLWIMRLWTKDWTEEFADLLQSYLDVDNTMVQALYYYMVILKRVKIPSFLLAVLAVDNILISLWLFGRLCIFSLDVPGPLPLIILWLSSRLCVLALVCLGIALLPILSYLYPLSYLRVWSC